MSHATNPYKRSFSSSVGSGIGSVFGGSGRQYYILEHKNNSKYYRTGQSQEIIVDQIEIGRDPKCQVRFDESFPTVSRRHAAIVRSGDKWKLVPLSTTNPTFLNGAKVDREWFLQNGDEIQFSAGGPRIGFIIPSGSNAAVGSLKLTRRLSLFRQQALRPYKQAITALSVALVLLLAGSLGYGIFSYQKQEKLLAKNVELATAIDENNKKAESLAGELGQNKEEMEALQKEAESLANELSKNNEQSNAYKREMDYMQRRLNSVTSLVATTAANAASGNNSGGGSASGNNNRGNNSGGGSASGNNSGGAASADNNDFSRAEEVGDINNLSHLVFAIALEKTIITYRNGAKRVVEEAIPKIVGTGFMLEDGRFVTARHVIEPWYYYEIIKDGNYLDYNIVANNGGSVVSYFTAISSSGKRFSFNGGEAKLNRTTDRIESIRSGHSRVVVRKGVVDDTDWATYQTHERTGLKFNNQLSSTLLVQTNLETLGFPYGRGAESIQVTPIYSTCQVAKQGLDVNRTIMVSNDNTERGNDGGPVFIRQDGVYQIVGILSGSTFAKGRVVPISAAL